MARIKIKGVADLITVDNREAKKVKELKESRETDPDQMVSVGNVSVSLKEISTIILDHESREDMTFRNMMNDITAKRAISVNSSAEVKSEKNMAYFKFMYKAKNGKDLDNKMLKLAYEIALKFFKTDEGVLRMWVKPDIWFKGFSDSKFKVSGPFARWSFSLVEKIERNEIGEVAVKMAEEKSLLDSVEKEMLIA